jgi:phosphate transport system substrate-binding protein
MRRKARTVALLMAMMAIGCEDAPAERTFGAGASVTVHGVGATVPKALFAKWAEQYALVDPATPVTYDAQGSGAGVRGVKDRTTDFGVSDAPLSDSDAKSYADVLHVPLAVEAIAIVYAVQGVPATRLQATEDLMADMFLGHVGFWDDPAIAAVNPGVKLPHTPVRIVYRGDESGSSYVLSEWLSKTTKKWTLAPSRSLMLPSGTPAQKDDGMLSWLRGNDGALGYVSAVTAFAQHLPSFAVRNPAGRMVGPSLEGMRAAAATVALGGDLRAHATAAPGELAYPLCSFTFGMVRADGPDPARRRALAHFLWWATHDGQRFAPPLGFGALPGELVVRDEDVLRSMRAAGSSALSP